MYSRNSFGSFYPVNSTIHRLNPVFKIINFILTILIIIFTNSLYVNSIILAYVIVLILLSSVPFKYYFNTFYSLRYLYILIAFLCAYFSKDIKFCIVILEKIVIVIEYINILSYTTSPSESVYGIEKFLSLFNVFYLKVGKLAIKINSLFRYYPTYLNIKYKTLKASYSRGISFKGINVFKKLSFNHNVRRLTKFRNKEVYNYSLLRLYNVTKYRTNYRKNKVGFYDIVFFLFIIALIYVSLIEEGIVWDI